MRKPLAVFATLSIFLAAVQPSRADTPEDRTGTAEFQYLETLIYARPAGLAGAYTSLAKGEDAVGYNPAGLARTDYQRSFSATVRYHMLEVASGNVTYVFPWGYGMTYAFNTSYINYGRIDEVDDNGVETGRALIPASFNPSLTASRKFSERLHLGATLKGLSEYLGDFQGSQLAVGWGVDAGLQYQPKVRNVGFGLALLNLGNKIAPHYTTGRTGGLLPVALKGGFFYSPLDLPKAKVAADLELPWHDVPNFSGGVEYAYAPSLVLRMGSRVTWSELDYYYRKITDERPGEMERGNALKLAGGFSFLAEGIGFDYAAQYWYGLSWVHALTLHYAIL